MPRKSNSKPVSANRRMRTPKSPDAREQQLITLAIDLAEQQLRDGTASSQVITHYLKLGSSRGRDEQEILQGQKELIKAKTKAYASSDRIEKLYSEAMAAFRSYRGEDAGEGDANEDPDL